MASKIWTGSLNFGLVTIPVAAYSATQNHTIQFHQYQSGTSDRVRYMRVNERTGKQVNYDDIVKGREVRGQLITVTPEELDEIAPGRSRTLDITTFVDLDEIDPIYFHKTYWLAPTSDEHARPYALLRQALAERNKVGLASFVLRGRQYLSAIRADAGMLALDTLFYADEIRPPSQASRDWSQPEQLRQDERRMATEVIDSMSGSWQPEKFSDTYTERVEELLESKRQGRKPEAAAPPPEATNVVDLTDTLRRSVEQARGSREPQRRNSQHDSRSSQHQRSNRDDLAELTKSELGRLAREHGIPKRSTMRRAELEQAIAHARTSGKKAS
ncbi:non-homologous end joining protein Ku [Salinifilum ghardaiensis]